MCNPPGGRQHDKCLRPQDPGSQDPQVESGGPDAAVALLCGSCPSAALQSQPLQGHPSINLRHTISRLTARGPPDNTCHCASLHGPDPVLHDYALSSSRHQMGPDTARFAPDIAAAVLLDMPHDLEHRRHAQAKLDLICSHHSGPIANHQRNDQYSSRIPVVECRLWPPKLPF